MLKPYYIELPRGGGAANRLFPYFPVFTEINDFHPKIGDRLTFPSHRSSIGGSWLL